MRPAPRYNPGQVTPRPLLSILRPTCCCGGAVHVYMLLSSLLFRLHSSFPHAFVSALCSTPLIALDALVILSILFYQLVCCRSLKGWSPF